MAFVSNMNGLNNKLRKMPSSKEFLLKHLADVKPQATSHGVGVKRVMSTSNEVGTPITQIAHTLLKKGEIVEEHLHLSMDEHFYFQSGECKVTIGKENLVCNANDYLFIPAGKAHKLEAISDISLLTLGIAHD